MKKKLLCFLVAAMMCSTSFVHAFAATTITSNQTGTQDGYDYELWKDSGTTSMTLNNGGNFSCSWSNIGNALFRKGKKFDSTKTHSQIGNISIEYGCDYQPNGNSYLCVYGWSVDPLVEFYIVDSWGSWRPTEGTKKGTVTIDGGTYDIYEHTRTNQPSIQGTKTFKQYWSVRTSKRTSGTISVSEHFKAWEKVGLNLGKMYEVALNVEGYQSSGKANVYSHYLKIGSSSSSSSSNSNGSSSNSSSSSSSSNSNSSSTTKVECESMTVGGKYTGKISSPFSGVALYANNDLVKYTQYFASGTHSFSLRGCSNNSNMAKVDLLIGGVKKGTFYFGGSSPAVYTINNVSHGTGNQEIQLVCSSDDGTWDIYMDYLEIK